MNILYKLTLSFFIILVVITGINWIRTPHLSSDISLKCETPEPPEQLAKLVIKVELFDKNEARLFTEKFAGFTWHSGGTGEPKKHEFYCGLYNVTFYGLDRRNIEFNMPFKGRYKTEILSEAQCIEKADQLIEEITDYFNSSLEYRVTSVEKMYRQIELVATVSGNRSYYYNRVSFDIYYDGVELLGKGTDAWVDVCDEEILGYKLHFPVLQERGTDKVYLTPVEALNRLESGSTVYDMKFGYYTNFVVPDNYSVVEYGYLMNGALNGDFMGMFIRAMAGDVYR